MKKNIVVPEIGESVSKGLITSWLKQNGESVQEGEPLFELETDKATVSVPSQFSGILEIRSAQGSEVKVGETVGSIDTEAVSAKGPEVKASPAAPTASPLSPSVRRVVEENRLDPGAIAGSGKGGRITKADALNAVPQKPAAQPQQNEILASLPPIAQPPHEPSFSERQPQTRVPMTPLRKRTAERLVKARQESVHVTTFNEIDMSKVISIRSHFQESFEKEHGIKIGYMSFFVKACCEALKIFPEVNAQVDGTDIVYNNIYNIGVAVSLEHGLIVPVIHNADTLTFAEIENGVATMARKARDKQLLPDDLLGGTFTITNGGVYGSLMSTPVPAYPQSAILGMHAIKKRPMVDGEAIVIRPMMYAALSYDHRIIDGKEAISFLVKVKEYIEEPDKLLLEM